VRISESPRAPAPDAPGDAGVMVPAMYRFAP
jgi:hypothetical protein